ncbi:MAG: GxxExxY protein [Nitrosomonadales bacterium]|nr:GxxExxY protein [Nitrosomonadales bacterium]
MKNLAHEEWTKEIIGAAFEVHDILGYGFLERVYQKALQAELISRRLRAEIEHPIKVTYKGFVVGDYFADLLVEESVVVELKISTSYNPQDEPQLLNELKATGFKVGLLINFGRTRVEFKRLVF